MFIRVGLGVNIALGSKRHRAFEYLNKLQFVARH